VGGGGSWWPPWAMVGGIVAATRGSRPLCARGSTQALLAADHATILFPARFFFKPVVAGPRPKVFLHLTTRLGTRR